MIKALPFATIAEVKPIVSKKRSSVKPRCDVKGVASYPGLLTPAFVACSNVGKGLVKLSHVV